MDGTWQGSGMCMLGVCLYASAGLKRSSSGCTKVAWISVMCGVALICFVIGFKNGFESEK